MSFFKPVFGIDLGSTNIVIYSPKGGIILEEPSVVAMDQDKNIVAIGKEAREMLGKTPDLLTAVRPIVNGVISDYRAAEKMISFFIAKSLGKYAIFRPEIMASIPSSISSTERRAVIEAVMSSGAREVFLVRESVLSAVGSGIPIQEPKGRMIINMGGGTTDIAVISLGGVVVSKSIKIGGNKIDASIVEMVKKNHNVVIGEKTAENIKKTIGSSMPKEELEIVMVKGRDFVSGLPVEIKISSDEVTECLQKDLQAVISATREVLSQTPPEISADIFDTGILLTGGGALLSDLAKFIQKEIGVEASLSDNPMHAVAIGTGIMMQHLDLYKRSVFSKKADK
jgi:rod shape-determining protein MreB and related proteins